MSEPLFKKLSDKLYTVEIEGETKELFVPMAKSAMLLDAFIASGAVQEDLSVNEMALVGSFERIASIVLNEHDENGKLVKAGNCNKLSNKDTIKLIAVGLDAFQNFIEILPLLNQTGGVKTEQPAEKPKGKQKKNL